MNKFVFTGPESSGKTTLVNLLASKNNGIVVEEYAREYLSNNISYEQKDLLEIAKRQFENQEIAKKNKNQHLFFDTDLLTIKIWSEYKYGNCDSWILDRILSNKEFTYILCSPDIPWDEDPLRENPTNRDELFKLYEENLKKYKLNYIIVAGGLEKRLSYFI